MSLASNFVLADSAAANKTFAAISVEGTSTIRQDTSSTNLSPRKMAIRHATATDKVSKTIVDRHLLSFSKMLLDTENVAQTITFNGTLWVPRNAVVTRADVDHLIAFARNFLGVTANVDSFLLGES